MAQDNLDKKVKDLLKESIFSAFFFASGIEVLLQAIDQWSDERVVKQFGGLWSADSFRKQIRLMNEQLTTKK